MRRLIEPVMNGNEARLRSHGGARFLKSPRPCLPGLTQVKPGGGHGGHREFISDGFREINALPTMDHRAGEEEKAAADFLRAAQAILRRSSNSRASFTGTDDPPITEPIPLTRKRPIPRP
jgi:hypothetical protein